MSGYYVELVCENGHLFTGRGSLGALDSNKHCRECGAPIIGCCPNCNEPIRGAVDYRGSGIVNLTSYEYVPAYCHECGKPYPWAQSAIEAATLLIEEDDEAGDELKEKAIASLGDVMVETPKTAVAASRFKKFMGAAGKFTAEGLRQIFVDVASEAFLKASGLKP